MVSENRGHVIYRAGKYAATNKQKNKSYNVISVGLQETILDTNCG